MENIIEVSMEGGCINGVYCNIPELKDVRVVFTEGGKYAYECQEEVPVEGEDNRLVYTTHVVGVFPDDTMKSVLEAGKKYDDIGGM